MRYHHSGHAIKPNHTNALPRYILSINVESTKEQTDVQGRTIEHGFRNACVVSGRLCAGKIIGRKVAHFDNRLALWQHIDEFTRSNYTTWLVGHDILYMLILAGLPGRFQRGEISIDAPRSKRKREENETDDPHTSGLAVIESPPTIIGCRVGSTQGRLVIVDTLNWFPGELPTGETAESCQAADRNTEGNSDDAARRHSESQANAAHRLFESLISWVSNNQMGQFKYTASGQAMAAYRHRFMEHQIYVHDNVPVQKQERSAYFGGRSEAFRIGRVEEQVYLLDCNSLFPAIMQSTYVPFLLNRYEESVDYLTLLPAIDWSAAVAEVEIDTRQPIYPLRTDLTILYPRGSFRTTLCGMELYTAFRSGDIKAVRSWSEYKLAVLFRRWVDTLWDMRQHYKATGNAMYEQFTKRIMNSLYGKFAQLSPQWVNCTADHTMLPFTTESRLDWATGQWVDMRSIGWQTQRKESRVERPSSFYAISAFVTAAARHRMNAFRRVAGHRNTYYQGVDSLIVNQAGLDSLRAAECISQSDLGKLRVDYTADYCDIHGISDYTIGSHTVLSGRSAVTELSDHGEVLAHRRYIREHLFRNGPIDTIEERVEAWVKTSKYNKGIVQGDGWVEPFTLGSPPTEITVGSSPDSDAACAKTS